MSHRGGCLALAGPIADDGRSAHLTNLPLNIDSDALSRRFGLRGYERSTLEEVGREIGLTRERVRQIQVEALRRLRTIMESNGLSSDSLFS